MTLFAVTFLIDTVCPIAHVPVIVPPIVNAVPEIVQADAVAEIEET